MKDQETMERFAHALSVKDTRISELEAALNSAHQNCAHRHELAAAKSEIARLKKAIEGMEEIVATVAVMPCLCQMAPDPKGEKHYDGCLVKDAIALAVRSEAKGGL